MFDWLQHIGPRFPGNFPSWRRSARGQNGPLWMGGILSYMTEMTDHRERINSSIDWRSNKPPEPHCPPPPSPLSGDKSKLCKPLVGSPDWLGVCWGGGGGGMSRDLGQAGKVVVGTGMAPSHSSQSVSTLSTALLHTWHHTVSLVPSQWSHHTKHTQTQPDTASG